MPNTSISELDTDMKVFVMEAIRRLVDDGLAEWDRTEDGELELRLITGETFVVGDTGITPKERSHDVAPIPRFMIAGGAPLA
jgi:hypothetical protein